MSSTTILLPFALPPTEIAADLLRELTIPSFATLLARATLLRRQSFDAFARALPHEHWLAQRRGLPNVSDNSPALAATLLQSFGLAPDAGVWFVLNPVHIHIARDHLVLTDQRQLELTEAESRSLFDAVLPLFNETGKTLLYGDARTWFVRADAWRDLQTSTLDAACGHNIDIWMPTGTQALQWRKLQNDVQMTWFTHPINANRSKPVNSLWLWGGSSLTEKQAAKKPITAEEQILDSLIGPALANDWAEWLTQFQLLEQTHFLPLLTALRKREIERLNLILTDATQLAEFTVTRSALRKFWRQPSLSRLK